MLIGYLKHLYFSQTSQNVKVTLNSISKHFLNLGIHSWLKIVINFKVVNNWNVCYCINFFYTISYERDAELGFANRDFDSPKYWLKTNQRTFWSRYIRFFLQENYAGPSNCTYNIQDADGWLQYMEMDVSGTVRISI